MIAPPSNAAFASVVMFPSLSCATFGGNGLPLVLASNNPKKAYAEVAMSKVIGSPPFLGIEHPIGLVPKIACFAPAGATNSGDCAKTIPTMPCSPIFFA